MTLAVDTVLAGRYRLTRLIAVGGMGEVWVARDGSLDRDVAVKVLRREFAGDAGFLERFRTEARNAAQLSHPNIAQVFDHVEDADGAFLVMELVPGEPMSELLERSPVLAPHTLLPILAQTARGLHAAHVAGVVHRDVKPGNILLTPGGRVKITDFGVSMASNQVPMTAAGMVMGTAQYLSPEQAMGRAATPASDLYALGIVAYESLVGHRPFTGPTAVDIAVAHVNTAVPPLPASVDPELADLVMRLLAKDPEARPRSAASLARTLDGMVHPPDPEPAVPFPTVRDTRTAATPVVPAPGVVPTPGRAAAATTPAAAGRPAAEPTRRRPPATPAAPVAPSRPENPVRTRRSREPEPARRTSTSTGLRLPGRLTWPLLALLLLLLGLAGAALGSQLARGTAGGPPDGLHLAISAGRDDAVTSTSTLAGHRDGMIQGRAAARTTVKGVQW